MRVLTASDRALLIEVADAEAAVRLNLACAGLRGVVETVPGARTVLIRFDPALVAAGELAASASALTSGDVGLPDAGEATIPVVYDGEDLIEAAGLLGVTAEELVARHQAASWRVAFAGFAPGFGYLIADDPLFDVPRRATPRTRVPAGSVGLAGPFSGVYPRQSPGGWQLIGRTDAVLWDVDRDPPALLAPGMRVRFTDAARPGDSPPSASESGSLSRAHALQRLLPPRSGGGSGAWGSKGPAPSETGSLSPSKGAAPSETGSLSPSEGPAPSVEVLRTALPLLIQDAGRPGHAGLGVSASGAADRTALRDANRAVGNAPGAAVLEGIGPVELRFRGSGVAVVTGAEGDLALFRATGPRAEGGRPRGSHRRFDGRRHPASDPIDPIEGLRDPAIRHGVPFAYAEGDELAVGAPARGLRFVLGVRGGIRSAPVLGSVATDTLSGLGPAPLLAGGTATLGDAARESVDPLPLPRALPAPGETVVLDVTRGPRDDWFTAGALRALVDQEWLVTPRSDRIGIRLAGDVPLERTVPGELPSEGTVTGALQVPPDGHPVLFLADHPITGGYPVIAAVADACLDLAAQLPPGCRVRFRAV